MVVSATGGGGGGGLVCHGRQRRCTVRLLLEQSVDAGKVGLFLLHGGGDGGAGGGDGAAVQQRHSVR